MSKKKESGGAKSILLTAHFFDTSCVGWNRFVPLSVRKRFCSTTPKFPGF